MPLCRAPLPCHGQGPLPPAAGAAETLCAFGGLRQGGGTGSAERSLPDGTTRVLQFRNGTAVSVDPAPGAAAPVLGTVRKGGSRIVTLGGQRFVMPVAVIFGG